MCALRFMDSFDHLVTADIAEKWSSFSAVAINPTSGRRGTGALSAGSTWNIVKILDNQPTWIVGCAFKCAGYPLSASTMLDIRDGTTSQVALQLLPTGLLQVVQGGTVLGTSTAVLSATVFYYLELLATIHASAGAVTLVVDGVVQFALTSLDTQGTVNAYANQIRFGPTVATATVVIDDVYMCDGTGSAPTNTLLGDCRVDCLFPTSDGSNSAWTPSTGTTHSTLVDEVAPNDDTDYLSTLTAGARESHNLTNLPAMTNPVIFGVQHLISARKDDAGTRQMKSLLKSGATTQLGSTTHTLASTYAYYSQIVETDPATGLAWTSAGVDALEAGFENQ